MREKEDAENAITEARQLVSDIEHLPTDYADRFMRNQYLIDPELRDAWDNRYGSSDAARWCRSCLRHAFKQLDKEARLESSRIAGVAVTQDIGAITAVMTRGHGKVESRPPDISRMSEKELREYTEREFGYSV